MLGLGLSIPQLATRGGRTLTLSQQVAALFASGAQGAWYDPSDYSTLFEDSAGTIPITSPLEKPVGKMLDKSGRGNHATQSTPTSRPTLSARVNQYIATETLSTQNVTTLVTNYTLKFTGSGTITLSGTATGVYSAGTHTITCTAGTLTSTVAGTVTQADLRVSNDGIGLPAYQRVNTATDYDYAGFPPYLKFDGVDDSMATGSIDFTGTDKMSVFAGVRKLSDAAVSVIVEHGVAGSAAGYFQPKVISINASSTLYDASGRTYSSVIRDGDTTDTNSAAVGIAPYAAPSTDVLAIQLDRAQTTAANEIRWRRNASNVSGVVPTDTNPSGNFAAYPLYIGRRGGTTLPFNGRLYSLVVCGKLASAAEIASTETWVNGKTKAF